MKKILIICCFLTALTSIAQSNRTGVNELTPEQVLHLGSQTGTIRVDGLNGTNNDYNGGVADQTYPVYVDANGDLTLEISATQNSDGGDAWITSDINGTVTIVASAADDGYEFTEILDVPITVTRPVIVELKYSLSMEVFQDPAETIIKDAYARQITNFFTLNEASLTPAVRRYGQASKCYFNRNDAATNAAALPDGATGFIYNSGTTYISLPAGAHILRFYGTVSSGFNDQLTHVRFAGGPDAIFIRIY